MKTLLKILGGLLGVAVFGLMGFIGWALYPHHEPRPIPDPLVALTSDEGAARLTRATVKADYPALADAFVPQRLASYCGVASGVAVLGALGVDTNQWSFFTEEASRARPRFKVIFGGMSLPDLQGLLRGHRLEVAAHHADSFSADEFRGVILRNLADPDDYLLVNYQREALGQGRVGHISPVAAYDAASDSVLIMDTAAHKYPPTWVPVDMLHSAMNTTDTSSGKTRGYTEVAYP
ncbi:MAG: phytochelatin synthase family protein [Pseudomonadota bacterium]